MKKLLLFTGVFLFCSGIFAQQRPLRIKTNSAVANKPHIVVKKNAGGLNEALTAKQLSELRSMVHSRTRTAHRNAGTLNAAAIIPGDTIPETIIGQTTYDLQTNGTISNRVVNVNKKVSATWTMSLTGNTTSVWPDRGTGYNYSGDDGATWLPQPTARVESFRTGYQNVACDGFKEAILAHTATTGQAGEITSIRSTQGSGSWTEGSIPGTTPSVDWWPKFTAGGADGHSFHAIWQGTGVAAGPLYYSRSTDDGNTWSTRIEIPGYVWGTDVFAVSADCYSIDARGDVIAIVAGDLAQDVTLLKSIDNGVTWTKRIIEQFPIPLYDPATMNTDTNGDGVADTLWSGTSDETVVIDNNNKVHVFYGRTRVIEDVGATGLSYFFTQDLAYWNEDRGDGYWCWLATPPDLNGDGTISVPTGCNFDPAENPVGYYGTGLVAYIEMPNASVDSNNTLYVSYQAADELSDTSIYGQMFMHPYIIKSLDGGITWTNSDSAYDVLLASQPTDGQSYDGAFAAIAKHSDAYVHLTYQRDFAPGTTLSGTNFPCEFGNNNEAINDMVYVSIPVNSIPSGTQALNCYVPPDAIQTIINSSFSISSNYPNPFRGKTSLDINLKKPADVSVEVNDLLGRVLSVQKYSNFNTGIHTLTIDATKFAAGVYTYKIKVGNDAITQKMIVQ
jgi:hypothetical protein